MSQIQHKDLAAGRWNTLSFMEQMANIGSEVERALNWKARNNAEHCRKAFDRAIELVDLSLTGSKEFPKLKELARVREALVDYFWGTNEFVSSAHSWKNYFFYFALAVRKNY